jgi:hypothetical protein
LVWDETHQITVNSAENDTGSPHASAQKRIDASPSKCRLNAMRYARPSCDECIRLAAEYEALYLAYVNAREALALTHKDDPVYSERKRELERSSGRLGEARKRDLAHEATHQDEFS